MPVESRALSKFYADDTLGSPENAVGFVLWKLVHRFQRVIDRDLAPLDLTHLQFTTLAMVGWLNRSQEVSTQVDISRYADIHAMQLSQILAALEAKGMIERTQHASNRRAKCVAMTRAGFSALRRAMPIAVAVQQQLFGKAGAPGGVLLESFQAIDGRLAAEERDKASAKPRALRRRANNEVADGERPAPPAVRRHERADAVTCRSRCRRCR